MYCLFVYYNEHAVIKEISGICVPIYITGNCFVMNNFITKKAFFLHIKSHLCVA